MGKFIDLTGRKFGRLRAKEYVSNYKYLCICECGKEKIIRSCHLKNGHTTSCGCYDAEVKYKHGLSKHPLFNVYTTMIHRCYSIKSKSYKSYGRRGIKVCEEWFEEFLNFYNWSLDNGYKIGLQLDRIDNNKEYSPKNCRFVSRNTNANNTSKSLFYIVNGMKYNSLSEASKENSVSKSTILRWCKGRKESNRNTSPRRNCMVIKKYV